MAQQPAAVKETGFGRLRFCLNDTLLPAGGIADGGKEKSRMTIKNLPIPTTQKPQQDFCVHAALGRLRFVSGSTAQLLYLIVFNISGTGVRIKILSEKSVRVRAKFTRAFESDLREQQGQQVYVHLRKKALRAISQNTPSSRVIYNYPLHL